MRIPKDAALIRGWCLFEAQRLLEEIGIVYCAKEKNANLKKVYIYDLLRRRRTTFCYIL